VADYWSTEADLEDANEVLSRYEHLVSELFTLAEEVGRNVRGLASCIRERGLACR